MRTWRSFVRRRTRRVATSRSSRCSRPTILEVHGKPAEYTYINHYLANGLALMCGFDDPRDDDAAETFAKLLPDRRVVFADARPIFDYGGGIHCITQQEPRPA